MHPSQRSGAGRGRQCETEGRRQRKQSFEAQGRSQAQLGNEEYLTQIGAGTNCAFSAGGLALYEPGALPQAADERRAFGAKQIPSTAWERDTSRRSRR